MGRISVLALSLIGLTATPHIINDQLRAAEKKYLTGLKEIHAEVKEMGPYPGQDFVQQAFFVGEDDDDTNKDIHVSILIQAKEKKERMTVRVTQMIKDRRNPQARLAGMTRALVCIIGGDELEIESSDYEEREIARLVPEILTAIRNKKRLLKLGAHLYGSASPG